MATAAPDPPAFAQVGGHAATIVLSDDSSMVNKPSSPNEQRFYSSLAPEILPGFIGTWTPAFYGTLSLQGKVADDGSIGAVPEETDKALSEVRRRVSASAVTG